MLLWYTAASKGYENGVLAGVGIYHGVYVWFVLDRDGYQELGIGSAYHSELRSRGQNTQQFIKCIL